MSVTRFSKAIGHVPDLNGCRKKIVEHCRDYENTIDRLEQHNKLLIQTSYEANKDLRNDVNRLEQENAELREFKEKALKCLDYTLNWAPASWQAQTVEDLLESQKQSEEKAQQILNK